MTGFEPGFSGIGSDRSANCATTTTLGKSVYIWFTTYGIGDTKPHLSFNYLNLPF